MQLIGRHYSKLRWPVKLLGFYHKSAYTYGIKVSQMLDLLDESLAIMRQAKAQLSTEDFYSRLFPTVQFYAAENQTQGCNEDTSFSFTIFT